VHVWALLGSCIHFSRNDRNVETDLKRDLKGLRLERLVQVTLTRTCRALPGWPGA
jgi:hypothetical protein